MTSPEKKLAKDIAMNLDRRRMRRRLLTVLVLGAAAVLAVLYLTCGRGFGIGGKGKGEREGEREGERRGPGSAHTGDAGPRRCAIRVSAAGLALNGTPATRDAVVTACKTTAGADVVVTGDARQGDWDKLRVALEAANVPTYKLGRP